MGELRFDADRAKAAANLRKHGVSFAEAEDRFLLLGLSAALRVLLVVYCYRQNDDTIRLISARRASRSEQRQYAARWRP